MAHRYATLADMVGRYGETEMLRLSVADGPLPATVLPERIERALSAATDTIDSYLRARYRVPLSPVPESVNEAACVLARFSLASGGEREPSEQMGVNRAATIAWLKALATGPVTLEGVAVVSPASGAQSNDRPRIFSHDSLRGL